jgi:amino-acid N-acetyltransferase
MLPRSFSELYENMRDFWVAPKKNKIIGCVALHIFWDNLAEVKCLAVLCSYQGQGVGTALVKKCIEEANQLRIKQIFTLTYRPEFFERLGFKKTKKEKLPHKIWSDCIHCPEFPQCNETALIYRIG